MKFSPVLLLAIVLVILQVAQCRPAIEGSQELLTSAAGSSKAVASRIPGEHPGEGRNGRRRREEERRREREERRRQQQEEERERRERERERRQKEREDREERRREREREREERRRRRNP
ncbi:hypothetical protein BKA69DRAFT_1121072 [Paraphysoderma sedebokerense]|nr:hypothetical protein BKA69DRAFT_1121072 [Paraphysoderma sedebokerense]